MSKIVLVAGALALSIAAPAFAAPEVAATAAVPTAKFTVDMPIETLAANPAAKAALDADFPGMTAHAMYDQFKGMSLKQLQPMAPDKVTDAAIAKLAADLAALK
jgi:hypothetical protein